MFILLQAKTLLYNRFIRRKPSAAKCYRLPLVACVGIVTEKHTYRPLRREWILVDTADGQQIKAYIPATGIGSLQRTLSSFAVGDKGTLHYRKGKKFNYFEEFGQDLDADTKHDNTSPEFAIRFYQG